MFFGHTKSFNLSKIFHAHLYTKFLSSVLFIKCRTSTHHFQQYILLFYFKKSYSYIYILFRAISTIYLILHFDFHPYFTYLTSQSASTKDRRGKEVEKSHRDGTLNYVFLHFNNNSYNLYGKERRIG